MRKICSGLACILSAIVLLSLCLTPVVFATEGSNPAVSGNLASPSTASPSDSAGRSPSQSGESAYEVMLEVDEATAADFEELWTLLYDHDMRTDGGYIRVTADLVLPVEKRLNLLGGKAPLEIDLGSHTLYVNGQLNLSSENLKFTGQGGDRGLIHINKGGDARIESTLFSVTDPDGYAIWQESGSILNYTANENSVGKIYRAPLPEADAATFEDMVRLLDTEKMAYTGGTIHVTDNLVLPAGEEYRIWPQVQDPAHITMDLGEHTLYVEGNLSVGSGLSSEPGVTFTGTGGKNGLIHVLPGGVVSVSNTIFTATAKDGYALWQAEGAILQYDPAETSQGIIHYAQMPVAVPYSHISPIVCLPVAVVHDGQTPEDVLPRTDEVQLCQQGVKDMDGQIPVVWDLEQYKESLAAKERTLITGSYPQAFAFQIPVCLVVFQNGNPATFLDCYGAEAYGRPSVNIRLELTESASNHRFEWSQDGETWLPANMRETDMTDNIFSGIVSFPDEQPAYPYYISAVVDYPDGSTGYSDVIVIEKANVQGGNGGNRGGGTDIIGPPTLPQPDPVPDTKPGTSDDGSDDSDTAPAYTPTPPLTTEPVTESVMEPVTEPVTEPFFHPAPPVADIQESSAAVKESPAEQEETTGSVPIPGPTTASVHIPPPQPEPEHAQPPSEPKSDDVPKRQEALPLIIGCMAVAGIIGAAGLCLHPWILKRLLGFLRKILER